VVDINKDSKPKKSAKALVDMLKNEKCSAYYNPWKYYIDEIEANDMIFLYSNGHGIIARGIATGITETSYYEGNEDEEHYMNLDRFQLLKKPLKSSKINDIIGHKLKYNQTLISLPHMFGVKIWQYITKECL
jgi:hypothetical protein